MEYTVEGADLSQLKVICEMLNEAFIDMVVFEFKETMTSTLQNQRRTLKRRSAKHRRQGVVSRFKSRGSSESGSGSGGAEGSAFDSSSSPSPEKPKPEKKVPPAPESSKQR